MTDPSSILEVQYQSLLELVERYKDQRCTEILKAADQQARQLRKDAHQQARHRMAQAIAEERERGQAQLAATEAQLQTRKRQRQHHTALLLLRQGWEQLSDVLRARWREPEARRIWVEGLISQALDRLPAGPWRIVHPPAWSNADCPHLAEIRAYTGQDPDFQADEQLQEGLRIHAGAACLDGSLDGLLADRPRVEAELLAQLNHLLAAHNGAGGTTKSG